METPHPSTLMETLLCLACPSAQSDDHGSWAKQPWGELVCRSTDGQILSSLSRLKYSLSLLFRASGTASTSASSVHGNRVPVATAFHTN